MSTWTKFLRGPKSSSLRSDRARARSAWIEHFSRWRLSSDVTLEFMGRKSTNFFGNGSPGLLNMPAALRHLLLSLSVVRLIPHIVLMLLSSKRDLIWADLDRWTQFPQFNNLGRGPKLFKRVIVFVKLMTFAPEYRTVFCLRTGLPGKLLSILCRRLPTLAVEARGVGAGLFINHGHVTFVSAETIGDNCSISHLVTIGYCNGVGPPIIGNNVTVHVGATIIGKVRVGDNSIVGANSLVLTDVPSDVTVIGVPAKIAWAGNPAGLGDGLRTPNPAHPDRLTTYRRIKSSSEDSK
jgi:serine O-acetyltransferase